MKKAEEGALARIIKTDTEWGDDCRAGTEVIIEDICTAEEAVDGIAFAVTSTSDGMSSGAEVRLDNLEVLKTSAEMRARKLPTPSEVLDFMGSELLSDGEDFSVTETDRDTENSSVELYGTTHDGLRFGITVQVRAIFHSDF